MAAPVTPVFAERSKEPLTCEQTAGQFQISDKVVLFQIVNKKDLLLHRQNSRQGLPQPGKLCPAEPAMIGFFDRLTYIAPNSENCRHAAGPPTG